MKYPEVVKALSKAKLDLISTPNTAFFATICFSLKQSISEDVPTAGTNGKEIIYNPDFVMALSPEERVFLLVHEAMHVALLHVVRLEGRDHRKWNCAADYVINLMLVKRGFKMPAGGLLDYQYDNMTAEQVYKLLPDEPPPPPMEDLMGLEGEGAGNADAIQAHTEEVQDILVRASIQSAVSGDAPGTIPNCIQIYLEELLNPRLPWNVLLRRYMTRTSKSSYSWRRPNRRYAPDHYLPCLHGVRTGHIAIAIDTSGSVRQKDFDTFVSEIAGIIKQLKPELITLIQFDTEIKSISRIKTVKELLSLTFTGRGGTRVKEVIQWIDRKEPTVSLIFTDGELNQVPRASKSPLIWLIHNNEKFKAESGKAVHYNI